MRTSAAIFLLLFLGCRDVRRFAQDSGLASRPAPAPEEIVILCDSGRNSTCSESSLASTLDVVLPYAAKRPGSSITLWGVAEEPTDSKPVATITVSAPTQKGVRARRAHERRFISGARGVLTTGAALLFNHPSRRATPLFETITIATLQPARMQRRLIVLSDLREHTPRTIKECATPPDTERVVRLLHRQGILTPGLLDKTIVHLAFVTYERVEGNRCAFLIGDFAQLQTLWRSVLRASGATVDITSGAPSLKE